MTQNRQGTAPQFPVSEVALDAQVTAKGWVWADSKNARLVFELSKRGKPAKTDAVYQYDTTITDSAGKLVDDSSLHLEQAPWKVRLSFSTQPEEPQSELALGKIRVPAAGKAAIVRVPPKLKERGIIFAALAGPGYFAFRDGQLVDPKSLKPEERWAATEVGWTSIWNLDRPTFIWIEEIPREVKGWRSLLFRGYSGGRRISLFQTGQTWGGCGFFEDAPKTARGTLYRTTWPLYLRAGQSMEIEGFDLESYAVDLTVPAPEPRPAGEGEAVIREFKISNAVFRKLVDRTPSTPDEHHAALLPKEVQFGPTFTMYSPASETLVIKASEKKIAELMRMIERETGRKLVDPVPTGP